MVFSAPRIESVCSPSSEVSSLLFALSTRSSSGIFGRSFSFRRFTSHHQHRLGSPQERIVSHWIASLPCFYFRKHMRVFFFSFATSVELSPVWPIENFLAVRSSHTIWQFQFWRRYICLFAIAMPLPSPTRAVPFGRFLHRPVSSKSV